MIIGFFIINNLNGDGEQGPYPPHYQPTSQNERVEAFDFNLNTPDGKEVKLSDYRGKVVILDFWATWCPPCRKGIPDLVELKKEYGSEEFEVIGISLDLEVPDNPGRNTKKDVVPFIEKHAINYPVVFGNLEVTKKYGGIESIPTTIIIDKDGKISDQHVGLVPIQTYKKEIERLLAE
ncbi:MAG: TlpA family protein disulfide reductase [Melioribacteraceae bacterium]|nr:TlpA family protein disulfide reductase [Melioribacteraceae bacterium]